MEKNIITIFFTLKLDNPSLQENLSKDFIEIFKALETCEILKFSVVEVRSCCDSKSILFISEDYWNEQIFRENYL